MKFIPHRSKFILLILFLVLILTVDAEEVKVEITAEGACFYEGGDSVLFYQAKNKSLNGEYTRANYIHPLYNLEGEVITEDFPDDHPHHRGIFWAWHQLYINETSVGDGWDAKDVHWQVTSIDKQDLKLGAKSIVSKVMWKSPLWKNKKGEEEPFIAEHTQITVYPASSNSQAIDPTTINPPELSRRVIDVEIRLTALTSGVKIGGSTDAKGYGGFSTRIKLGENVIFTGQKGVVEAQNLPIVAGRWMDISQPHDQSEAYYTGFTIIADPKNPGYPNPWILRAKNSMQNAVFPFPGAKIIELPQGKPLTLRYRMVIHSGKVDIMNLPSFLKHLAKE